MSETPWRKYRPTSDGADSVHVGPLRLDLRRDSDEYWIAWEHAGGDGLATGESEWQRFAAEVEGPDLIVRPAFPDRTLIVAPEVSFHLAPRSEARVFVRVPLFVQILMDNTGQTVLAEVPSLHMSDTWWGDFVKGEVCYWLPTTARRSLSPELIEPHLAACPLAIKNLSSEVLHVDKIAVRGVHLSLFETNGRLWADETTVRYSGDEEGSEILMSGKAPAEAAGASLVTKPRVALARGLRARTFARLKSLSGI